MRYKKWRYKANEYFTFTRRERNGILVLSLILIALQISIFILHFLPDPDPLVMDAATIKKIKEFDTALRKKEIKSEKKFYKPFIKRDSVFTKEKVQLFTFNPNTLDENGWKKLGFSEKQSASIIKWRDRAGKFHNKEEIEKVFVINPEMYKKIFPFIAITIADKNDTASSKRYSERKEYPKPVFAKVELNSADETALRTLPQIGEGRAKSIIRYRGFLGGFINVAQLPEVRNLPDSVIQLILPRIEINIAKIKLLNINTNDPSILRHPYLSKSIAEMIVNYHREHGDYKTIEELRQLPLFNEELYRKIAPYLTVNPN